MIRTGIFMADGCEEIEGLTVVDLLRRAGIEITMISINGTKEVKGAHGIVFQADADKADVDFTQLGGIILPGGMPGTIHLGEDKTVDKTIREFAFCGKLVAAICAAPGVPGAAGLLKGKRATCYPGCEEKLVGAEAVTDPVVRDGNIITSRGMGTAIPFALEIVKYFTDEKKAAELAQSIIY